MYCSTHWRVGEEWKLVSEQANKRQRSYPKNKRVFSSDDEEEQVESKQNENDDYVDNAQQANEGDSNEENLRSEEGDYEPEEHLPMFSGRLSDMDAFLDDDDDRSEDEAYEGDSEDSATEDSEEDEGDEEEEEDSLEVRVRKRLLY